MSGRLFSRLRCASCHDRDDVRSHRTLVVAEEGGGRIPDVIPSLTWAGEKLKSGWMHDMLAGKAKEKSRPWIEAQMPAFEFYARPLAEGFAAQHAAVAEDDFHADPHLAEIGRQLSLQTGLDCRQCHAIGDQQPRGDEKTAVALGINFYQIRDRMRRSAYTRFMIDPPRYDSKTRMIRLSEDGLTTQLKGFFDSDARRQFDALWHYIQSLPAE